MGNTVEFIENIHYYLDEGKVVLTETYHKNRGFCCGKFCRHCCFEPKYLKGNTNLLLKTNKNNNPESGLNN